MSLEKHASVAPALGVAVGSALLPPTNKRRRFPQVCGHCQYFTYPGDGLAKCIRPNGPAWDSGDGYEWMTTCDRFKKYRDKPEPNGPSQRTSKS